MNTDILFKTNDYVFSYRVGGIIINDGKILLQKPLHDDYAIIGGHVSLLETTVNTLKREFEEETSIPKEGSFWGYDELDNQRTNLEYCWVPLEDLKNGLKVYPVELIPYILEDKNEIVHFISKEI